MTRYKHTQIGHVVIWAVLVISVVVAIETISQPSRSHEISVVISLLLFKKKVPLAQIIACEPIRIRWWYGWGIHLTPYGWLYNVSGLDAVAIALRTGRKFGLGTDDPHGLVAAIWRFSSAE